MFITGNGTGGESIYGGTFNGQYKYFIHVCNYMYM